SIPPLHPIQFKGPCPCTKGAALFLCASITGNGTVRRLAEHTAGLRFRNRGGAGKGNRQAAQRTHCHVSESFSLHGVATPTEGIDTAHVSQTFGQHFHQRGVAPPAAGDEPQTRRLGHVGEREA